MLAEAARARFESRRDMEWRVSLALWSAFGAGFIGVLAAKSWNPTLVEAGIALLLSVVVIAVYYYLWHKYLNDRGQREIHQQVFWQSFIQKELGQVLPEYIQPPDAKFATASNTDGEGKFTGSERDKPILRTALHVGQKVQILVAVCFALLFVGAIASRAVYELRTKQSQPGAKVVIEGESVEIDSLSKIKTK